MKVKCREVETEGYRLGNLGVNYIISERFHKGLRIQSGHTVAGKYTTRHFDT